MKLLIRNNSTTIVFLVALICIIDIVVFPILTADTRTTVAKLPYSMRIMKALLIALIAISYSLRNKEVWQRVCIVSIFCLLAFWFKNVNLFDSVIGWFLMQATSIYALYVITKKKDFWLLLSLWFFSTALLCYYEICMDFLR